MCPLRQLIPFHSCPAATYPLGHFLAPTPTAAAAQLVKGFAAFPLVTIGVTNTDVTNNSDVDDGAAVHGMDCT